MTLPLIAAGAAAIRILPAAASVLRGGASIIGGLLKRSPTYGGMLAFGAAAVGVKIVDHENDGALSYGAIKTAKDMTVSYLNDKIKEGYTPEQIESSMAAFSYMADVSKTFKKGAQNAYVDHCMMGKDGADAILTGKRAAVEFQLLPDNMISLSIKQSVRTSIADGLFKGDRNAADKYLAQSLIDDIVKNAQVIPLKDNQVSRDDVKAVLTDIINKPEKHPLASKFFGEQDRLMNGLRQIWPELDSGSNEFQRQQQSRVNAGPAPEGPRSRMADSFKRAVEDDNDPSVFKVLSIFLTLLLNLFGGNNLASQFRGASLGHDGGASLQPSLKPAPTDAPQNYQARKTGPALNFIT